ncbi:monovalent cation/H+ antiporter complex subunit F [Mangrovicoccus ximenensis]|uniref:monovalent cation/H+ antiporter complex subunit F n=1 Tax=Mangrovicoccus ximenensis TaxID=1911570 RepID=UPI000D34C239|nr:cation:proton antiporter [Mangrovicoccus ximenensis]
METLLYYALTAGFAMVVLSLVLAFFRLVKGPSLPDRVVALDMMTLMLVVFCGLTAISFGHGEFLDVALVLAIVGFLATVALARYAERSHEDRTGDGEDDR